MLDKKDAQWWILEAQKRPEAAIDLVRMLADRMVFLDKQNEELRGELITMQRKQRGESATAEIGQLQRRIQELEAALRQNGIGERFLVYAKDRIEANLALSAAQEHGIGREMPGDVGALLCDAAAKLLIVTAESQVFSITLGDLPATTEGPALLGNPNNVAAILDQAIFEDHRFLTLVSQRGFIYSVLVGTVNQVARRREKLLRNMVPDDPIVAAVPSYNADIIAISQKGRWTRFAEKTIAGTGSLVMDLPKGDTLAGIVPLSRDADLILLTTDGKLFVRPSTEMANRKAPGSSSGMLLKGQNVFGVMVGRELFVLTRLGKVIAVALSELPFRARTESGVSLPGLSAEDSVLAFAAR
jgi:DNA gyrase/topoisomerase IV subunit A